MKHKLSLGFSIVELITVLTIAAMLIGIAFPTYNYFITQSRRHDAINTLRSNQLIVEKYMQENGILPTDLQVNLATESTAGFYEISYNRVNDTRYTLVATAVAAASQAGDTGCTTLTLTSEMDDIYPVDCR